MAGRFDAREQMVVCSACGRRYRCLPSDDYYNNTTATDGVCEPCLCAGKKGAAPPAPGSIGPILAGLIEAGHARVQSDGSVLLAPKDTPSNQDTTGGAGEQDG